MHTLALPAPSRARTRQRNQDELDRRLSEQTFEINLPNIPDPRTRFWVVSSVHADKQGRVSQSLSTVAALSKQDAFRRHRKLTALHTPDREILITAFILGGES